MYLLHKNEVINTWTPPKKGEAAAVLKTTATLIQLSF